MPTQPGLIRSLAASYWAAEERRDIDAVMAHYHPDATYQDAAGQCQGTHEIRAFYAASVAAYPRVRVDILREYRGVAEALGADGDAGSDGAALEFGAVLTDQQGRDWVIRGINVFRVRDGRFTSVRSYEDPPAPVDG